MRRSPVPDRDGERQRGSSAVRTWHRTRTPELPARSADSSGLDEGLILLHPLLQALQALARLLLVGGRLSRGGEGKLRGEVVVLSRRSVHSAGSMVAPSGDFKYKEHEEPKVSEPTEPFSGAIRQDEVRPTRLMLAGATATIVGLALVGTRQSDPGMALALGGAIVFGYGIHAFGRLGQEPSDEGTAKTPSP